MIAQIAKINILFYCSLLALLANSAAAGNWLPSQNRIELASEDVIVRSTLPFNHHIAQATFDFRQPKFSHVDHYTRRGVMITISHPSPKHDLALVG